MVLSGEKKKKKLRALNKYSFQQGPQQLFKELSLIVLNSWASFLLGCGEVDPPSAGATVHRVNEFQMQNRVFLNCHNANLQLTDVFLLKFPPAVQVWVKNGGEPSFEKSVPIYPRISHCHIYCVTLTQKKKQQQQKKTSWPYTDYFRHIIHVCQLFVVDGNIFSIRN